MEEARLVITSDGRVLRVRVSGPVQGPVMVYHHGTPGCATRLRCLEQPAHTRGWRVVSIARPGYGDSSRRAGRRVVDVVEDTDAVLDALGASSCVVAGWSGGGPHALACAARLTRARAALVIAGVMPFGVEGVDALEGMGQDNLDELAAAGQGPEALRSYLEADLPTYQGLQPDEVVAILERLLPEVDRAVLTGEFATDVAASYREGLRLGVDGWLDDDRAFVRPWGFGLDEIVRPVTLWQGVEDLMVPVTHGRWLAAHVPGVRAHILEGEGHLSVGIGMVDEMLDELGALARL